MHILDTDHLSILQRRRGQEYGQLLDRLRSRYSNEDIITTIISFQEHVQGWLARLNRNHDADSIVHVYKQLNTVRSSFCKMAILPFDDDAQERFGALRKQKVRIGTMDPRIACIALVRNATLLSRNLRDYQQVPELKVEDWTQE